MKIAFLQPPPRAISQSHDVYAYPHLGLGYLAGYLEREGYDDLLVIDGRLETITSEQVVRDIADFKPDLLCITAKTHEISHAAELAEEVKRKCGGVTVIVGGCHITAEPESTLLKFPAIDYGLVGEGELALAEICSALDKGQAFDGVSGLVWRSGESIIVNPRRPFIEDLDSLPFPAWHRFRIKRRSYMIFGSRGCPYQCAFCMQVLGRKPRLRSPENIIAEIDWLVNTFDIVAFDFEDETFGLNQDDALRICDLLIERGYHKRLHWTANMRANLARQELLNRMKAAGCVRVAFGVESGNPEILKNIGKAITIAQIENAFQITRAAGLESVALFILGHPNETEKTARDTINLAVRLNPTSIAVGIMVPYPGTRIREMALRGEGGYRMISDSWDDYDKYLGNALELETLTRKRLERLQIMMYLKFYLYNFRVGDLWRFARSHFREASILLRKLLFG